MSTEYSKARIRKRIRNKNRYEEFGLHLVNKFELDAPANAASAAVLASVAGSPGRILSSGFSTIDFARTLTCTGTSASADNDLTIYGVDILGKRLTETFALTGTSTIAGSSAFSRVDSISIEGFSGGSVAIGTGNRFGLPELLEGNTVLFATADGVKEAANPTVVFDNDELAKNLATFVTSTPDGSKVFDVYYISM